MRRIFIKTLIELAEQDERILLLTGDLGFTVVEPFADRFPRRFFNMGVAEQNMVGVATGLAEAGFIPFVYSIATFAALRPYEFIRNGPILHQFPVRIVGIGGGFDYGFGGITHYSLEDVGVMRLQPGISVIVPCDYQQARSALLATWNMTGPIYYRLGIDDKNTVTGFDGKFEFGRVQLIDRGGDLLFIAMGAIAREAASACTALATKGISASLGVVAAINPPPVEDLAIILRRFKSVITVESHYLTGGLGSLVSEAIADNGLNVCLLRCGARAFEYGKSGSPGYMEDLCGLSAAKLVESALRLLNKGKER